MKPIAIDAYAGAGGLTLGLERAGFRVALAFDNDPISVDTHRKNIPGNVALLDAAVIGGAELLDRAGVQRGEVDLLAGGPPCQGFSLQRRGARHDQRNLLVLRFLEWITQVMPKSFLIENVPSIRGVRGRELMGTVEQAAAGLGFTLYATILDAAFYGIAQRRRRAFLVGVRRGLRFEWPEPSTSELLTVQHAISDLPSPPLDGSPHREIPNHYREARLSALNRERIRHVPEGGGREDLPSHLWLSCHANGHRHLDTYGRLSWAEVSSTITARFDSFTRGRFGHPTEDRSITLREGARLQGFPDEFVFLGNREQGARMIGNAVPPPLAEALGHSLLRALADGRQRTHWA